MLDDDLPCCSNQNNGDEALKSISRKQNRESSETSTSEPTPVSSANEAGPDGEEDIVDLCRQLDTQLEEKAKMHNLNALNVKSILHRLIRDPHVLSTLMGIKGDADDIPTLKVTRSKVKHSASETAKVELKPVQPPRTFLDVQFENEDEDEDYRPEEAQSDESEEEDDGNDTLTLEPELAKNQSKQKDLTAPDAEESSPDLLDDALMISDGIDNDGELSPYQLRSRVPHIEENTMFDPLDNSFPHESFDTFTDYHGQEMLTFVENPDYLNFLQGIQASTPAHENENVVADDDDPDDEEYNVLTELDKLKEFEKDKDEIRMDRFTEIPMREVEGLFMDLIGDDVGTIQPELISIKTHTPKKKRAKKRRSTETAESKKLADKQKAVLPVDEPPPDGSYSCSLISGVPITFKPEELAQLRIQLEQHVQLLAQSVVMCFHDDRLLHVKNDYQLMINDLDTYYYQGGESSLFNIDNLPGAIESCHDIMAVTPVEPEQVKWDPNPFGWSPRPEAALVLGRSRAIIYPDLLPGVQPDLFAVPHQFFTPGEDLLLAHALIQFRHIPQSSGQDPFGRLYWVQKMLLPCKSTAQIRAHIRLAKAHTEGQVINRNPIYQIIVQALNGVCHLRFPFERPLVRYETMQMWPDEERPIWFNKFLRNFMTIGPTMIVPCGPANRHSTPPPIEGTHALAAKEVASGKKSNTGVCSTSIFYEIDVAFQKEEDCVGTGVIARPFSYCSESACAFLVDGNRFAKALEEARLNFVSTANINVANPIVCTSIPTVVVKEDPEVAKRRPISQADTPAKSPIIDIPSREVIFDLSLYNAADRPSWSDAIISTPGLPDIYEVEHIPQNSKLTAHEPSREQGTPSGSQNSELLHVPKSEFSLSEDLEEGEIVSAENSREVPVSTDRPRTKSSSSRNRRSHSTRRKSRSPSLTNRRREKANFKSRARYSPYRTSNCHRNEVRDSRRSSERTSEERKREESRIRRARYRSSDADWEPEGLHERKRMKREQHLSPRGTLRRSSRRQQCPDEKVTPLKVRKEESVNHQRSRKSAKQSGQKHYEFVSCSVTVEFRAKERTAQVFKNITLKNKEVIRTKGDLSNPMPDLVKLANVESNMPGCTGISTTMPCLDYSRIVAESNIESPSKTSSEHYCSSELLEISAQIELSRIGNAVEEEYSCTIPRTPTFDTPSNCSPLDTPCKLSGSRSGTPDYDFGVPATPRDDAITNSPTLLRAPSAASRALFAKIEVKRVSSIPSTSTITEPCSSWRSSYDRESSETSLYNDHGEMRPCSAFEVEAQEDCEDITGSKEMDDSECAGKTRMKRRTRTEKERMGLEQMQNLHYRARQMQNLARKIFDDIRQRTFMHQDVWRTIEKIVLSEDTLETQFDRLQESLLLDQPDILALLSLLIDDAVLPPDLLTSPLRRGYYGAVQMLLAIEAYCHGTRSRSSNTRSLLKTIGSMGGNLNESEFCDRLSDLLSNERPLWNYIRQWLPLPYDENVTPADFEFIDLRKTTEAESMREDGAELIDDLNALLGALPPRKGGSLQVAGGQLNILQNGTYMPVLVTKEGESLENKEPTDPSWTKEVDITILKTYNSVEGSTEDVVKVLAQKIPYSFKDIEKRLNFLLSLF